MSAPTTSGSFETRSGADERKPRRHDGLERPDDPAALCAWGESLGGSGQWSAAEVAFRRARALAPGSAAAQFGLATACLRNRRWEEGARLLREGLERAPADSDHWSLLAKFDRAVGAGEDAVEHLRRAAELAPADPWIPQRRLVQLLALPGVTPDAVRQAHADWAAKFAAPLYPRTPPPVPPLTPDSRRRIGYVSPDWRDHPVGRFSEALLRHHDRRRFEVFGYSRHAASDERTRELAALPEHWVEAAGWDDATLAARIRQDGIHLLIDLAGHTRGGDPWVFARQPAPVQVAFLGYPATTGIATIGYRLTDAWADPPSLTETHGHEQLVRLATGAWCFSADEDTPPVSPLPCADGGGVTFGSFANLSKLSTETLALWARVLTAVPGSRLVLKSPGLDDPGIRARTWARWAAAGITAERVILRGSVPDRRTHLAAYQEIDVALDSLPYGGTATTCDALLMGVPVMSLAGASHVSRVGVSLLHHAGLTDACLASSADDFVGKAVALAGDRAALSRLRQELRPRLERSPLMDAPGYTRSVENALDAIWRDFTARTTTERGGERR